MPPSVMVRGLCGNTVLNSAMKPVFPLVLRATRWQDQNRERIRDKHYSLRTEQACVQWGRMFVSLLHSARSHLPMFPRLLCFVLNDVARSQMPLPVDAGPAHLGVVRGRNINHFGIWRLMGKCKQLLN